MRCYDGAREHSGMGWAGRSTFALGRCTPRRCSDTYYTCRHVTIFHFQVGHVVETAATLNLCNGSPSILSVSRPRHFSISSVALGRSDVGQSQDCEDGCYRIHAGISTSKLLPPAVFTAVFRQVRSQRFHPFPFHSQFSNLLSVEMNIYKRNSLE